MEDVDIADASKALFEAPFGMLAHRFPEPGEEQSEPTFVYANQVLTSLSIAFSWTLPSAPQSWPFIVITRSSVILSSSGTHVKWPAAFRWRWTSSKPAGTSS